MKTYRPSPLDTSHVSLPADLIPLVERLAAHVHERWAEERLAQGWTHGPARDDKKKQHPSLIPYADLPESEKLIDRTTAIETLKAILALGWEIEPKQI